MFFFSAQNVKYRLKKDLTAHSKWMQEGVKNDYRKEKSLPNDALQRSVRLWKALHFKDRTVENDHFNPSTLFQ